MYPRALAPPWEDIEICPCLGVSLCVSLPLPPVPLPGLPIWLVWFSEALIPSGLRRGTTAVAPRSPPSLCGIPCVLPSSPAPLTPSACCCLITWLGAKSAVIKTAHSLFSWLFQKGEEQELKWDSHVSASLDGGGEGRRIVYPGPGLGVGGWRTKCWSQFQLSLHLPWDSARDPVQELQMSRTEILLFPGTKNDRSARV